MSLPVVSGYHTVQVIDTAARKENLATVVRLAQVIKKYGGRFMVLAPNGTKRDGYNFQEHRANIVAALNEYAMAVNDAGLGAGLHQHTGTAVETRDETYAVMEAANTSTVEFAPDVGTASEGRVGCGEGGEGFPSDHRAHASQGLGSGGNTSPAIARSAMGKVDLKAILDMVEGRPSGRQRHARTGWLIEDAVHAVRNRADQQDLPGKARVRISDSPAKRVTSRDRDRGCGRAVSLPGPYRIERIREAQG